MTPLNAASLVASRLTGLGRGAVTTIGLRGHLSLIDSHLVPRNRQSVANQSLNQIVFGHWRSPGSAAAGEEVVFCRVADDQAELHCHGGAAVMQQLLDDLMSVGAVVLPPDQFLEQITSEIEADCALVLSQAQTRHAARILLRQSELFPDELQRLRSLPPEQRQAALLHILSWQDFGKHLTQPWKVVLTGPPNAGKSTLLNALVGFERAIVFDQPGTTRDVLSANTAFAGWPVQFIDTAGLRTTDDALEATGIELARQQMQSADLILALRSPDLPELPSEHIAGTAVPVLHVWNKLDQFPGFNPPTGHLAISARFGQGLDSLIDKMLAQLNPRQPGKQQVIPCSPRQVAWLSELLM